MRTTLIDEYNKYETIRNKNYEIENLDLLSPTAILLLICGEGETFEKINGLKKITEYNETDKFENEILSFLNISKSNKSTLSFILHEIIGNIYDHSQFNNGFFMAKAYKNFHEISFIDDGITIPQSLKNANHLLKNDFEYIIEAIMDYQQKMN